MRLLIGMGSIWIWVYLNRDMMLGHNRLLFD